MKIVRIFGEKLWGVKRNGEDKDEFSKAFSNWHDIEYLEAFFESNREDLQHGFYRLGSVEEAIWATIEEAKALESRLLSLCRPENEGSFPDLDSLFVSLHDQEFRAQPLSKRKAKGPARNTWLRIYAIKIEQGCYLIVGSAIKLSRTMQERPHTMEQLRRMEEARAYLKSEGIEDLDGFRELVI
jgi:hypothetical protein